MPVEQLFYYKFIKRYFLASCAVLIKILIKSYSSPKPDVPVLAIDNFSFDFRAREVKGYRAEFVKVQQGSGS